MDREEERLRKRAYRARKRQEAALLAEGMPPDKAIATVLQMPPPPARVEPSTSVQEGVQREVTSMAASEHYSGLVAAALAMAKILDDPKSVPQHPGAARSLEGLLARLHDLNKGKAGGKLAAMRSARGAS